MQAQDSLELFDIGVLLQALSTNLKVGVLAVRSGGREKFLHLDRSGVRCVYAVRPRVSLQKVLFNHRTVDRDVLRQAAEELGPDRVEHDLAEWLVSRGLAPAERVTRARSYQLLEEVLELFYWHNVGFEFYSGEDIEIVARAAAGELVTIGEPIHTESLLLQCTKTVDDIAKFNSVTPSLRDVYELHFDSIDELERAVPDEAQREFMLLIDGVRDMREVLRDMRMNRFEVLELFHTFRQAGRIRPKNAFELLMLAENRRRDFSMEKRARVLERVNELGVEGFGVVLPLAETYESLGDRPKAAEAYRQHAQLGFDAGESEAALRSIERAAQLAPDDLEIRRLAIGLLEHAGRYDDVAEAYKALAEIQRVHGDLAGARASLEAGIRTAPEEPVLQRRLGENLAEQGQHRLAAVHARRAGDLYLARDEMRTAADCFRRTLALWPRAWSARFRLARALHRAHRDDVAIQVISDIARFVEDDLRDGSRNLRVTLLRRAEDLLRERGGLASSAARHLASAYRQVDCDGDAMSVLRDSVASLSAARRFRTAVEVYADLVDLRPDDVAARRGWARCHAALGDRNRALAQLRRASRQLVDAGEWEFAGDVYTEMLEIEPTCLDAHIGLARALLNAGSVTRASEHFHRAGLLYRACGRGAEALPYFREAVDRRPGDAQLLDEYCELLIATDAEEHDVLNALAALVELRMERGEHALAAMALTRILAIDPRFPGAKGILNEAARQLRRLAEESEDFTREEAEAFVAKARADAARHAAS